MGGMSHSLVLLQDGTVMGAGSNAYGQLGDGSNTNRHTPVQVSGVTNAVAIAAGPGAQYSLFLLSDGTVLGAGLNAEGQLADGSTENRMLPVQVNGLSNAVLIAGGFEHSLFVLGDGAARASGNNEYGQLGDGTTTASLGLTAVLGLDVSVSNGCSVPSPSSSA